MTRSLETIHFYHTNDIHSHFESWPKISRLLCDRRSEHSLNGEACYIFDIGDYVDRSHPFTEGTLGKGNVNLLNEAGYDAVTIGNNEGITMSRDSLSSLYTDAEFDVILGNLFEKGGNCPNWAVPYKIYVTALGTKIGVIGATAEYTRFYSKLGWEVTSPRLELKRIAELIIDKTDLIVCLSHMGLAEDEKLAIECGNIDVIFGAHTHHLFHEGKLVENTLLAATGKYGDFTGHVTVEFDTVKKKILDKRAVLYRSDALVESETDIDIFNQLIAVGKEAMAERVFYNPTPLSHNLFSPGPLTSFFGRALVDHTGADCAMFNAGIFLGSLEKGWVTKADLHALLPHPINPCVVTLDGAELKEVYELSHNEEWPQVEIKGLGFRGTLMGAMIHERLFKSSNGKLYAGNREVVAGQKFTLATLDMFTFGFFFPLLKDADKDYYMPELLRDVAGWYGRILYRE
jgi:5'-nucleotidase